MVCVLAQEKRSAYAPSEEQPVRYDGIYRIARAYRKPGAQKQLVCRYVFIRCDNEPAPWSSEGAPHMWMQCLALPIRPCHCRNVLLLCNFPEQQVVTTDFSVNRTCIVQTLGMCHGRASCLRLSRKRSRRPRARCMRSAQSHGGKLLHYMPVSSGRSPFHRHALPSLHWLCMCASMTAFTHDSASLQGL